LAAFISAGRGAAVRASFFCSRTKEVLQVKKTFALDFRSDAQRLRLTREKLIRTMRAVFEK
jgi:hypothetical protein